MARIPFDIKYRPEIEAGKYKVETKENLPVRIICWDRKGYEFCPICGLVYMENQKMEDVHTFRLDGTCIGFPKKDLFLVPAEPGPELTEFEKAVKDLMESVLDGNDHPHFDRSILEWSQELLEIARKQIEAEDERVRRECDFKRGFDRGYQRCFDYHGAEWLERQKEQNPAEWSEEDEKMRCNILNVLTPNLVCSFGKGTGTITSTYKYDKEITWLKSLPARFSCPKKSDSLKWRKGYYRFGKDFMCLIRTTVGSPDGSYIYYVEWRESLSDYEEYIPIEKLEKLPKEE